MPEDGLWIQSVTADGDLLSDSLVHDGVIRTADRDTRILFGFSNAVASTVVFTSTGASVTGDLAVDGGKLCLEGLDVAVELANARDELDALRTGSGLADGAVLSNSIAESNVPASKVAGVLPVAVGGTGAPGGSFPHGAVPFAASDGEERLVSLRAALSFDPDTATLAASNATVGGRLHSVTDALFGRPGDVRYRLRVDYDGPERDLLLTRLAADGSEEPYINFRDVKELLDNVGVS